MGARGLTGRVLSRQKNFQKGIDALQEEGAVQVFTSLNDYEQDPILAACGNLQFEVVASRLGVRVPDHASLAHLHVRRACAWLRCPSILRGAFRRSSLNDAPRVPACVR